MGETRQHSKVISIYSGTTGLCKTGYAINLAAALARIIKEKVLLIDMDRPCKDMVKRLGLTERIPDDTVINSNAGIDILTSERIDRQGFEEIRNNYRYIIINLPPQRDVFFRICADSNAVHFFVDSTKDSLRDGHNFFKNLIDRRLEDIYNKSKVIVNRLNIFDKFSVEEMSWLLKRDIWAVVPELGFLEAYVDAKGTPLVLQPGTSLYAKAVMRIVKRETGKLIGLALGSGAAFGLAHIGVLKVLEENNIPIDIISGSSIGALIASMWGLGFSSAKIENIARKLRNRFNIVKLLDFTIPISGILAGKRLRGFLRKTLKEKTFEDLQIPVKIMVYDLANRETFAIEKGFLEEGVYMSMAVPGIFEPKREKGRTIIDGGVADPVPVDALLKGGVKKIIAVNVLPGPEDIYKRNMLLKEELKAVENVMHNSPFYMKLGPYLKKMFMAIFTPNIFDVIMSSMQSTEYMLAENSCKKADVVLHPVFPYAHSIDFHLVKNFIKTGEDETVSHIKEIERLVDR